MVEENIKRELTDRESIHFLINAFYSKIRKDDFLGPIFNSIIKDWPSHLDRLTDFWATNLLFTRKYRGNPLEVHRQVDEYVGKTIQMEHFGKWLQLWFSTIDEHFLGENAEKAKQRARKMSTIMFLNIFEGRSK